jgi:hypothetical protein
LGLVLVGWLARLVLVGVWCGGHLWLRIGEFVRDILLLIGGGVERGSGSESELKDVSAVSISSEERCGVVWSSRSQMARNSPNCEFSLLSVHRIFSCFTSIHLDLDNCIFHN